MDCGCGERHVRRSSVGGGLPATLENVVEDRDRPLCGRARAQSVSSMSRRAGTAGRRPWPRGGARQCHDDQARPIRPRASAAVAPSSHCNKQIGANQLLQGTPHSAEPEVLRVRPAHTRGKRAAQPCRSTPRTGHSGRGWGRAAAGQTRPLISRLSSPVPRALSSFGGNQCNKLVSSRRVWEPPHGFRRLLARLSDSSFSRAAEVLRGSALMPRPVLIGEPIGILARSSARRYPASPQQIHRAPCCGR